MPACDECGSVFAGLLAGRPCNKCAKLSLTQSDIERAAIKAKPQCRNCSIVYGNLLQVLCGSCLELAPDPQNIPPAIAAIPGAVSAIVKHHSATDLGPPRAVNPNLARAQQARLTGGSSGIGVGATTRGMQIVQQMQHARQKAHRVNFVVTFSTSQPKRGGGSTFTPVPEVTFNHGCDENDLIEDVVEAMILKTQQYHQESFKDTGASKITKPDITIYSVPTANSAKPLHYVNETQMKTNTINLRFIVPKDQIWVLDEDQAGVSARVSTMRSSKRVSRAGGLTDDTPRRSGALVRKSAYMPPLPPKPRLMRAKAKTAQYWFRRFSMAGSGRQLEFRLDADANIEMMDVADDWQDGMKLSKSGSTFDHTGYIGSGLTKVVVYGRLFVENREYAIAQVADPDQTEDTHLEVLQEELRILSFGDELWSEFLSFAREEAPKNVSDLITGLSVRFNFKDAFVGKFVHGCSEEEFFEQPLVHAHFLATPLLPCGSIDKPLRKFTGNENCGAAPHRNDLLTASLHAFTHWMALYTNEDALICDIQGIQEESSSVVLIDPQMHTSQSNSQLRMYWDKGPRGIEAFLEHHLDMCNENPICYGLNLRELKYQVERPKTPERQTNRRPPPGPTSPPDNRKRANRGSDISSIMN
ncbi:unnamed protein product [Mycena citricolor]|uniref:Alpha-type protein kinase domain-containing protein n=1 Tax=Mycena citricolor TaxID=2018698 RepID=A0AAD2GXQ1_9AGAR|nr:unnamed protein product [Mycena citricolor]